MDHLGTLRQKYVKLCFGQDVCVDERIETRAAHARLTFADAAAVCAKQLSPRARVCNVFMPVVRGQVTNSEHEPKPKTKEEVSRWSEGDTFRQWFTTTKSG